MLYDFQKIKSRFLVSKCYKSSLLVEIHNLDLKEGGVCLFHEKWLNGEIYILANFE